MLHDNASSKSLALLRITVFSIWFVIAFVFSPRAYATLPQSVFEPWGLHRILNYLPNEVLKFLLQVEVLTTLKLLILAGCFLCILGIRPFKPIALATFTCIFLFDFIIRGFNGFINHAQIGIYFAALYLAFSPAADSWSIFRKNMREKSKQDYYPVIILTGITLTMAYSFIGIRRLFVGGSEIFLNDALVIYTIRNTLNYSMYGFEVGLTLMSFEYVFVLLKIGFFVITIMEILSPFIFFNRYLRYTWLSVMVPFHFITLFTMNIFFWENILLILVIFIKWENFKITEIWANARKFLLPEKNYNMS